MPKMTTSYSDAINTLLSSHKTPNDLVVMRVSTRAKRLIFKSSLKRGVEIVVPRGANLSWVLGVAEEKIPWITSAQQRVREGRNQLTPSQIELTALGETWTVVYRHLDKDIRGLVAAGEQTLLVSQDPNDLFHVARQLQQWFHKKASASLLPWLDSLANVRRLKFNRTYVKNQVSRWGSCSEKRNINLNRNLLFIPERLVEYVLHHELTHLDHLNHSKRFWTSFSRVLPNCQMLRRELRSMHPDDIPLWASPGLDHV